MGAAEEGSSRGLVLRAHQRHQSIPQRAEVSAAAE